VGTFVSHIVIIGRGVVQVQLGNIGTLKQAGSRQFAISFYRKIYEAEIAMWQNI